MIFIFLLITIFSLGERVRGNVDVEVETSERIIPKMSVLENTLNGNFSLCFIENLNSLI